MPINHTSDTGQTLYARFHNSANTAVDLTEGTGLQAGMYTATDAEIRTAGLTYGTYPYRIFHGTASAQAATDTLDGAGKFVFNGNTEASDLGTSLIGIRAG